MIFPTKKVLIVAFGLGGLAACETTYDQAVLEPMIMADGTAVQNAFSHAKVDGCLGHTVTVATTGIDLVTNKHLGFDEIHVNTEVGKNACAHAATGFGIAAAGALADPADIDNSSASDALAISGSESVAQIF